MFSTLALTLMTAFAGAEDEKWEVLQPKEGNFKIEFPGKAKYEKVISPNGNVLHGYSCRFDGDKTFCALTYSELPAEVLKTKSQEKILDDGRDAALKGRKMTLIKEEKISSGKHPGRYIVAKGTGDRPLVITTQIFVVENRVYQVMFSRRSLPVDDDIAKRMFDSFTLIPGE
jgi:hypothetical protein